MPSQLGVALVQVDADRVPPVAGGDGEDGAGTGEGVENEAPAPRVVAAVGPAEGLYAPFHPFVRARYTACGIPLSVGTPIGYLDRGRF
jgi:hypothetical protein